MKQQRIISIKIKAVCLDLGGVVFRIDPEATLHNLAADVKMLAADIGYVENFNPMGVFSMWPAHSDFELGRISSKDFYEVARKYINPKIEFSDFIKIWNGLTVEPLREIPELMRILSERVALYALTNTNALHIEHFRKSYPFFALFRKVFASNELNLRKPDHKIFKEVIKQIGFAPHEILFFDDTEENVASARECGLNAEYVKNDSRRLVELLYSYGVLCF